jgi:hypothetical protein
MVPINNSDTAWLVVTDYKQENDLPYEELREDVLNPTINPYYYEYHTLMVNSVGGEYRSMTAIVGSGGMLAGEGNNIGNFVGGGENLNGALVGGIGEIGATEHATN